MEVAASQPGVSQRLTPCDLVMKGGVASGIVYPGAIAEISEQYQFHGIGGSSAGAIGALGAAAAELGRYRRGDDSSFRQVAELAEELSAGADIIGSLFQPAEKTEPLFKAIVALGDAELGQRETLAGKYLGAMRASVPSFPKWAAFGGLAAAVPGILFVIPAGRLAFGGGWSDVVYLAAVVLLALLGVMIGATLGILYDAQRTLRVDVKDNLWGMCSGLTDRQRSQKPALTDWMIDLVDKLAAPKPSDTPVTFGDLWYAERPTSYLRGRHTGGAPAGKAIDLQVITTSLSDGQPYRFPFQPEDDRRQRFYFRREDFLRLFPLSLVEWLERHPAAGLSAEGDYLPLPNPADLPIVMAARLSLSFPGLLSAVPLYRKLESGEFRVCWFSDGGIASNFPIHFFDSPVPRWPTLAINLAGPPEDPCSEECWGNDSDACQEKSIWSYRGRHNELENVTDFAMTLFNTARNWSDNTQADLPGYKDRIIFVGMNPGEGGLNLNMPRDIRERLAERGGLAGERIRDRFHLQGEDGLPEPTAAWDLHRWTRYRLSMSAMQELLGSFHRGYTYPPADPTYVELIDRGLDKDEPYHWLGQEHHDEALNATNALDCVAAGWHGADDPRFAVNAPMPPPELRIRPRI